jgi:4a-hydroxytetrahydrobiopterin dehydratase
MSRKLSRERVKELLDELPDWTLEGASIVRKIEFPSFPDAIAFVTRLGFAAEANDHHPDLLINFKRVTVTWTTHSEDGLTDKDFAGARQTDVFATVMGVRSSV